MKLGTFMMPLHPPGRLPWQTYEEDREAILLADKLGYAEALVGEHVTDLAENVTSCLMFLASLANETKDIVLGSGTVNMPNSHPAAIAAQVAMLDHLLKGRFIFGISPGGLMSDAEVFGNFKKDRNAIFLESINMVLDIWAKDGPYELQGNFFSVTTKQTMIPEIGQGTIIKPYQKPHPPIVVTAVAPHSKGVTEAAKRGWNPISANFLLPEWVASHWPKYQEGCIAVGKIPQGSDWRVAKSIFVADNEATAKEYGHGPKGPYYFYFKQLLRKLVGGGRSNLFKLDQNEPDSSITADTITPKLVIAGTPDSVVEQILAFREKVGPFGTLYYPCHDWVDPRLARRSMQLMAEQVMPRVNDALEGQGLSERVSLRVNGQSHEVEADPATPLLYILRNDLGLKGTRFGCGTGHCGACTVVMEGRAVQSCDTPLWSAAGKEITTIEGLGQPGLREIFLEQQAAQCGYCINGILMSASTIKNEDEILKVLDRHLCRCGTHVRILKAIRKHVAGKP